VNSTALKLVSFAVSAAILSACGGGSSGSDGSPSSGSPPPTATAPATAGVYKGTITSTTTNAQPVPVIALTGPDGHSAWMTADGRVWSGQIPQTGSRFEASFSGHMYDGLHFPDGTNHGTWSMTVDHRATGMTGQFHGSGDTGSFAMELSPMWNRTGSMSTAAGVYTRTTSSGYAMTMTIGANGQITGQDTRGCVFNGTVTVPDPTHNLYRLEAAVSSCGALDGPYTGMGTLVDADAMRDWMTSMHPLEHGGHSHGGGMMGGGMMGGNTVPTGTHNLFMFCLANSSNAIMDALVK
jgi:hypothetical protein